MPRNEKNAKWSSSIGFVLATAGAAIGLGNIQRFPYLAAEEGGATFVFVYLFCILILGLPLILAEFSIGRFTEKNPVGAIHAIRPKSLWAGMGFFAIITSTAILSYYAVVGGWSIACIIQILVDVQVNIRQIISNPLHAIGFLALFISIVMLIVIQGIQAGIERFSKILMPILFILLIILAVRSVSFPNSMEGIRYYLMPNFSKLNMQMFVIAAGQAFFALSIGEGLLITYGSFARKKENLFSSAINIVIFDTLVGLIAGLIIFPAIFSFGENPKQGVELIFIILPKVFAKMPLGYIFGSLFFLLLSFAAITSGIAFFEVPVCYLIQEKKWSRKKAVWIMGILVFLLGIPSALSQGASSFLSNMQIKNFELKGFYNFMDFFFGDIALIIGGLLLCIFTGWVWQKKYPMKELSTGSHKFGSYGPLWYKTVRYVAPLFIIYILLDEIIHKL